MHTRFDFYHVGALLGEETARFDAHATDSEIEDAEFLEWQRARGRRCDRLLRGACLDAIAIVLADRGRAILESQPLAIESEESLRDARAKAGRRVAPRETFRAP